MPAALHGTIALDAPFPGLRAFEAEESLLFYGREVHVAELLDRLGDNRFVAVIGTSGSGKSSLVRAGLRPAMQRGYLVDATSRWRFATMRPGGHPIEALAESLAGALDMTSLDEITRTLRATSAGISQVVARAGLVKGESLLVIADQFEELFRFDVTRAQESNAALFVSLLLDAVEQRDAAVYVVVTMRSEFLGRCSEFSGLAEAFNRSQYLVPRLTREERREAIERPLGLFGTSASPALVQQVLNDTGDDPDQLPVLQHALLRTYRAWERAGGTGRLEREHYSGVGGIEQALDRHGDEIVSNFSPAAQQITERLYRSLTVAQGGVALRRPRRMRDLYDVALAADPERRRLLDEVVTTFASRDNSFVMLSSRTLAPDTMVDITHESLIRKWKRLGAWVREESRSAEWYADLARDVARHRGDEASLWQDPELAGVRRRQHDEGWNETWANQYRRAGDPPFSDVESFLDESVREQDARRRQDEEQRNRELLHAQAMARAKRRQSIILALLLVGVAVAGFNQYRLVLADNRNEQAAREYNQVLTQNQVSEKRLQDLTSQQRNLQRQIAAAPAAPGTSPAAAADAARLQQLTQEIERTRGLAKNSQDELAKLKKDQELSASDRGGLLKQIESLQGQLKQATNERDAARGQTGPRQSAAPPSNAADTAALQRQLDEERKKSADLATANQKLINDYAALRVEIAGSKGAAPTDAELAKTFEDGVRAFDLKDFRKAAQLMRTSIALQAGAAKKLSTIRMSGTRFVPYAPYWYLAAALFEAKESCSEVMVAFNLAGREASVPDVKGSLNRAEAACAQ